VAGVLRGTVALVTGASSGIGEATARELAARGAAVAVAARRADRLGALAEDIGTAGGSALALDADVTDEAQARDAVERTVATWGRLDILVNNAGVARLGSMVDGPVEDWEQMVRLNVLGQLYCVHAALPHLLRAAEDGPRRVADLVSVSSVSGRTARKGAGVYSATKHAVNAFSESLRQEVAGRHVRVCVLEPGAVTTELFRHRTPEVQREHAPEAGRFERLGPEDVADTIGYVVTRPRHVALSEVLMRPSEQER
jgi:NADP-dependent 3-hydroxy acid dehydrogenase YdfG